MIAQTHTLAHHGAQPHPITIETDVFAGLPGITIVGLPSKSIEESRERIRSAIRNSGLEFPPRKVTINLAPADVAKTGINCDLAIAAGILIATQQIKEPSTKMCFVAELALDGSLRPTQDCLASVLSAERAGFTTIVIDPATDIDIPGLDGLTILRPHTLRELYLHLLGETTLEPWRCARNKLLIVAKHQSGDTGHFGHIRGQLTAKRALQIAAAGRHNLLMIGPPGVGKTLLAQSLPELLPPADLEEAKEIHYIHSLAGEKPPTPFGTRPFRAPHHNASQHALIGGGSRPRPGEISLAHRGVLFLDELPEFPRTTLEALRQPIENGEVHIARTSMSAIFPAQTLIIAAMNPCPCGHYSSSQQACSCSIPRVQNYQKRISGPLLDRFDLIIYLETEAIDVKDTTINTSVIGVQAQVKNAASQQAKRFDHLPIRSNGEISYQYIRNMITLDPEAERLLESLTKHTDMNQRSIQRIQRVARTIADLEGSEQIHKHHLAEAMHYKQRKYTCEPQAELPALSTA
ncbi:ATP-binding protein [Patescibacteria group bacterium]|nr:MAG: ATP-binding protein [Patescibacteria group bacterium]